MDLKSELQQLWGIASAWQLIPLGKGYYTLRFTMATDKAIAKEKAIWKLSKGNLRLREWTCNFDPFKKNSHLANVWVRIHYLPIEYWNPQVISGIGRFLGHPLKIDGASAGRDFGQFARILVEIDMSLPIPNTILIDMEEFSFHVEFVFENLSLYCGRCKITGHSPNGCRKNKSVAPGEAKDTNTALPKQPQPIIQKSQPQPVLEWQQVGGKQQVGNEPVEAESDQVGSKISEPKKLLGNSFGSLVAEDVEEEDLEVVDEDIDGESTEGRLAASPMKDFEGRNDDFDCEASGLQKKELALANAIRAQRLERELEKEPNSLA
ncbi:uncharacterized protein LOC131025847 [Salvia miltiorrhiza]|uniref:uncharacterized protein LOC131025847 n=1 Tax=Salvia miltiorrhiza TaxID=226208 RepID=UPI0025AB87C5|nr:uncharacterized protein LOC131025847 [Salvia miltiorrhiza]